MKHLLLNLASTPDRALRLLAYCLDRSDEVNFQVESCGTVSFSDLDLPGFWSEPDPAKRFRDISVWLVGHAAERSLIEVITSEGGKLAAKPADADLLVAIGPDLAALEQQWPRRLVVPVAELKAQVNSDQLRPLRSSSGPPGSLPKQLRGLWNQLRSGSVRQILDGLEAFSAISQSDSATADLLLQEVGVDAATGTLIHGNRFERVNGDANPHLLYALLGLLSRSAVDSRGALLRRAVRHLQLRIPSLPEIRGFESLRRLELELTGNYGDPDGDVLASIAERFGPLPALEVLRIEGFYYSHPINCLDGLDVPLLKDLDAAGIGLKDIKALRANQHLQRVMLSGNEQLSDLSPLKASVGCLRRLEIYDTAVRDLGVLAESAELDELEFSNCKKITTLNGLQRVTVTGGYLRIDGLPNLTDLRFLPKPGDGELTLSNLDGITSLDGIEAITNHLTALDIHSLANLKDVTALSQLQRLETLRISDCPQITSLKVLAELPCLKSVQVDDCRIVSKLPEIWPTGLETLGLGNLAITQLGCLPPTLTGSLNLIQCPKLTSLEGLEHCTSLRELSIRPSFSNLQALATLPNLWIAIDFADAKHFLPDALIDALAALPQCRLRIGDGSSWSAIHLRNPEAIAKITHLRALDLSSCELDDIHPVMGLSELELLKIRPRTELSKKLGGCTFDTPGQVAKLQLQLLGMS